MTKSKAVVRLVTLVVSLAAMTAGLFIFNTGIGIAFLGFLVFDAVRHG